MSLLSHLLVAEALSHPTREPFPGETLLADGWEYRDLPRMTPEYFDKLIAMRAARRRGWRINAKAETTLCPVCASLPVHRATRDLSGKR